MEKIVRENVFQQKKKKLELKFNPGLVLVGLQTTRPRILNTKKEIEQGVRIVNLHITNLRRVVHLADYAHGNNRKSLIHTLLNQTINIFSIDLTAR